MTNGEIFMAIPPRFFFTPPGDRKKERASKEDEGRRLRKSGKCSSWHIIKREGTNEALFPAYVTLAAIVQDLLGHNVANFEEQERDAIVEHFDATEFAR